MLEEALEHLVKGIVDHPDDVRVSARTLRRGRQRGHEGRGHDGRSHEGRGHEGRGHGGPDKLLEVRVHPDDLGKIIGRQGRTAKALRTVMSAIGGRGVRVDVVDTDAPR